MDAEKFLADLEAVPSALSGFADKLDGGELRWPVGGAPRRIVLTGMGSSFYAASMAGARLRALGLDAVAELASNALTWPPSPDLLLVVISAGGSSAETLAAMERHVGISQVVALTNVADSAITQRADQVVEMFAGAETGGVACRTYRHTMAALLALEERLTSRGVAPDGPASTTAKIVRRAATASQYLLDRRDHWLPDVSSALATADGTWFLAPAERLGSALQGALMVREGPRRRADGCETGDWSHVDVYLTKTLDYRGVVFTGSRYDAAAASWMIERGSTIVAVGGSFPGSRIEVRYPGDDDQLVATLAEILVPELVAATWWSATGGTA